MLAEEAAAREREVMHEQLDFLAEHTHPDETFTGCDLCERYWLVRKLLLESFTK